VNGKFFIAYFVYTANLIRIVNMSRKPGLVVDVEPAVLQWAVETSGRTPNEIAKKLKVTPSTFQEWCSGSVHPTVKQLEDLSRTVKRPLAAFFLSQPPTEAPLPKDYRQLPGKEGKFDPKTVLAIRRARRLRTISRDLADNLNMPMQSIVKEVKHDEKSQTLASHYRQEFGFSTECQENQLKTPYDVFTFLRTALEKRNILVFQMPMRLEDARGFALVNEVPQVIVVNSGDTIEPRIFTLMHEFGHVLKHESGVSMPERTLFETNVGPVERWCNDFAAEFLFPRLLAEQEFTKYKGSLTDLKTLGALSRHHKVSKGMLLYNMYKFGFLSQHDYHQFVHQYRLDAAKGPVAGFRGEGAEKRVLREKGHKFVSLVATNYEQGLITRSDALDFLSIKSPSFEKVLRKVKE
jgi:Zn-dependent peptidase ImmA (M78 family)/transcriptional regulator with XRE-family HTH domain